jgi:hypothetical protein
MKKQLQSADFPAWCHDLVQGVELEVAAKTHNPIEIMDFILILTASIILRVSKPGHLKQVTNTYCEQLHKVMDIREAFDNTVATTKTN